MDESMTLEKMRAIGAVDDDIKTIWKKIRVQWMRTVELAGYIESATNSILVRKEMGGCNTTSEILTTSHWNLFKNVLMEAGGFKKSESGIGTHPNMLNQEIYDLDKNIQKLNKLALTDEDNFRNTSYKMARIVAIKPFPSDIENYMMAMIIADVDLFKKEGLSNRQIIPERKMIEAMNIAIRSDNVGPLMNLLKKHVNETADYEFVKSPFQIRNDHNKKPDNRLPNLGERFPQINDQIPTRRFNPN